LSQPTELTMHWFLILVPLNVLYKYIWFDQLNYYWTPERTVIVHGGQVGRACGRWVVVGARHGLDGVVVERRGAGHGELGHARHHDGQRVLRQRGLGRDGVRAARGHVARVGHGAAAPRGRGRGGRRGRGRTIATWRRQTGGNKSEKIRIRSFIALVLPWNRQCAFVKLVHSIKH